MSVLLLSVCSLYTVSVFHQGRTNKLVDGCYSFWQGGVFPLIYLALKEQGVCVCTVGRMVIVCITVVNWLL